MKRLLLAIFMLAQISVNVQAQEQTKAKILFNYFDAETQKQLELTDEQKAQLLHIKNEVITPKIKEMNASNLQGDALRERKNEINYETRRLYFDVLTREQKKKVSTIIAEINKQNKANGFD